MSHSLIILPQDSNEKILDAISQAKHSLAIKMFVFQDRDLLAEVLRAHTRGVTVRVMLNPERRDGRQENDETRATLKASGIAVKNTNPAFDLTHEKSMVVDEQIAFVQSFNWESSAFTATRDYGLITSHQEEVEEILACFNADWHRNTFIPQAASLLWCVGNARKQIGEVIDRTRHSLWIQSERFQDPTIIEHLVRACRRGVRLHIMARELHKLKPAKFGEAASGLRILEDVGAHIRTLKHIKLHGKLIYSDDAAAVIGSINLAPGSFDSRRELAIETTKKHVLRELNDLLHLDWKTSSAMDLSDSSLLKECSRHNPEMCENLRLAL